MAHIQGTLQALSIVTNTWQQSLRFYTEGLGYNLLDEGELSKNQKKQFGKKLKRYVLLGHTVEEGNPETIGRESVVRLIETTDRLAQPNRIGARPWDNGMCVFEAGTPDVERAYFKVLRARFGAICPPSEFDCEAPDPLGYVLMRSTAFIGPSGEQVFVTQIVNRRGGTSLLKEKAVDGINVPANVVISLKNREQQAFYKRVLGIYPINDLPLKQPLAAAIMAGPSDMGFDMCLMGNDTERIGMEQHLYAQYNPLYDYKTYPCSFEKTGLASAAWLGKDLAVLKPILIKEKCRIIGDSSLPIRGNAEPDALVFEGIVGEILELIS
jgi:hypothetical protein